MALPLRSSLLFVDAFGPWSFDLLDGSLVANATDCTTHSAPFHRMHLSHYRGTECSSISYMPSISSRSVGFGHLVPKFRSASGRMPNDHVHPTEHKAYYK